MSVELLVVIPVYDEEDSIRQVVEEWHAELVRCTDDFVIVVINDGSKDSTLSVLRELEPRLGRHLEIIDRENRGHGQSCLEGYRLACERGVPWVFQVDSDGQCDPQYFRSVWELREDHDVVYGRRQQRDDGRYRSFVSFVLRWTLVAIARTRLPDPNVPYRLMRTEPLPPSLGRIGPDFYLANVALAILLKRRGLRHSTVPIRFRERHGGEPMISAWKFASRALELFRQLRTLESRPLPIRAEPGTLPTGSAPAAVLGRPCTTRPASRSPP